MIDWQVGDKVVCIYAFEAMDPLEVVPVKGVVYTIREIEAADGFVFIRLVEIVNDCLDYVDGAGEVCFWAARFRKVQPSAIKVFTDMLTAKPVDRLVDA